MAASFLPFLLSWPRTLMRDRMWQWELAARTVSGGKTLGGAIPIARIDGGGLWTCTLTDVQVSTADQVRVWRALSAALDAGATPLALEARDELGAPWPTAGSTALTALNDDGSGPDDGSDYVNSVIDARTVAAAALRATTLTINVDNAAALKGGEFFSIEHETQSHRLYRISAVRQIGNAATIQFRPPLREAIETGTRIEFDRPKCVMMLAAPDAMDLALTRRFHGQATVKFVERLGPFTSADVVTPPVDPPYSEPLYDDDGSTLLYDDDRATALTDEAA